MNTGGQLLANTGAPLRDFESRGGYRNFADTGGFNTQDQQDFRARAMAPIRSAYAGANREIDRAKSLQGGYAPNFIAAKAKGAREQAYALGDASTNIEASLHDAMNQNKLAGLSGLTGIDNALLGAETSRMGIGSNIFGQMNNLYGTAPGAAKMYGDQLNTSTGHTVNVESMQNEIMKAIIAGKIGMGKDVKGNFQSAMDNIGGLLKNAYGVGGLFSGFGGAGTGGVDLMTQPYGPGY